MKTAHFNIIRTKITSSGENNSRIMGYFERIIAASEEELHLHVGLHKRLQK